MKKNIIGKIITVIAVICVTIEIGITIGCFMISKIDFNKYKPNYTIEVVR